MPTAPVYGTILSDAGFEAFAGVDLLVLRRECGSIAAIFLLCA